MERTISRSATFQKALLDFEAKVRELTTSAVDGRSYVRVGQLREWMRETGRSMLEDKYVTNTDLLVHAAYYGSQKVFLPIAPSRISDQGRDCCLTVFIILLDLGLGHLIDVVAQKDLVDGRLPEDLSTLKRKLKGTAAEQVADQFNERQWKFCPAMISWRMEKDFVANEIIPICRKDELGKGGTAEVHQIVVQAEFVDNRLKELLKKDQSACYDDEEYGPCYLFALKTFQEDNFEYYYDEKAAFDGLQSNPGVISRLGCYSHQVLSPTASKTRHPNGNSQSMEATNTMNLLLEYGTLDLRLVFGHELPPVFPKEILAFWTALFKVAEAVKGIHEFKAGGREFNGWHADIKPENIIRVRGEYKLADPGFARFKKKASDKCASPQTRIFGGTDTYGAPEVSSQANVHQTIDTWSLGCVFSVAATWIILGESGIAQYQQVREKALGRLLKAIEANDHPLLVSQRLKVNSKPEKLDCFHDGTEVLSEVKGWHTLLKSWARKTDPITEQVLGLVDQKMLVRDPKERITSTKLCEELKRMTNSSRKVISDSQKTETHEYQYEREHMEGILYEIDKESKSAADVVKEIPPEPTRAHTSGLPPDRKTLRAQLENTALRKTSHRFGTIPEPRPSAPVPHAAMSKPTIVTSDTMGVKEVLHRSETGPKPASMSVAERRRTHRQSTFGQQSRTDTGIADPTLKTGKEPPCQNAVQARESIEQDQKKKKSRFPMRGKKLSKNEILSQHFQNRDIKFVVDDAVTMLEHWDEAIFLLETLVMIAHGQDPDGPDLIFSNKKDVFLNREKVSSKFRWAMQQARPKRKFPAHTNMSKALESIFVDYLSHVRDTPKKSEVNALTIIVLTDGLWDGMNDKNSLMGKIVDFYHKVRDDMQGLIKDRQVSIEFIQFGDNPEAQERLRRLDDDMPYSYDVGDIIDFERFSVTGNVYKMLLGSFNEEYDAIDDDIELEHLCSPEDELYPSQSATSPPARTQSLREIPEEQRNYTLSSTSTSYNPSTPRGLAPATPQSKSKKSSRLSRLFSET